MNHGSLFSGIGGFDLAAEEMGWNNIFHCEIEPFPREILNYYWPKAKSYDDIKTTDFTVHRGQIDILTGGFPCQPYSLAGSRKGKEDDRHLWPEMLRAIRECQPTWIVGENVPGIISWNGGLVFEEVCIDLENEGYEVQPIILPAASKDAPHKRDRVWFVAYSCRKSSTISIQQRGQNKAKDADANRQSNGRFTSDTERTRLEGKNGERMGESIQPAEQTTTDSNNQRRKECNNAGITEQQEWIDRKFTPLEGWQNFPTQPPVRSGNDGIPSGLDGITFSKWRNESIKGYGNAVVPQVVVEIFKVVEEMKKDKT